jgi:hypothetical protein
VRLELKFSPGQVLRYRAFADLTANMDMNMSPQPPQPIPMQIMFAGKAQAVATAKVVRRDAYGGTRLQVRLDNGSLAMDMMGKKLLISFAGGKVVITGDGQKISQDQLPQLAGGQAIPLLQKPIEVKLGKRGQILDITIPGFEKQWQQMMAQVKKMYAGTDPMTLLRQSQVLLPADPVAVGDNWRQHVEIPVAGAGTPVVYDMTFTLDKLAVVNGKQIATISTQARQTVNNLDLGAMAKQGMPPGAPGMPQVPMSGKMSGEAVISGKALFNVTAGTFDRYDFRADMNFSMNTTVTGASGQQPITMAMNMAGQISGALARL